MAMEKRRCEDRALLQMHNRSGAAFFALGVLPSAHGATGICMSDTSIEMMLGRDTALSAHAAASDRH